MSPLRLFLEVIFFGYTLWLGLYLIARNPRDPRLYLTGIGLLAYGIALAIDMLSAYTPSSSQQYIFTQLHQLFLFIPALSWTGTVIHLMPSASNFRRAMYRIWLYGVLPATLLLYLLHVNISPTSDGLHFPDFSRLNWTYLLFAAIILIPFFATFILFLFNRQQVGPKKPLILLLAVTLFFGLGTGMIFFPLFSWLPTTWVIIAIGVDLLFLGGCIAMLDAFEGGEALLPDVARSLDAAILFALIFGGVVALIMVFSTGVTYPMILLLLIIIALSIGQQVFSSQFDAMFDRVAFAAFPQVQQARENVRLANKTTAKTKYADPTRLSEAEFVRATRRALSHYGDLPRLATSPLTQLPGIEKQLAKRGTDDDMLERAAELKRVLTASIDRLKPRDKGDFGMTDEWRYYNALYFPYVLGLRPYSRRADHNGLDADAQTALDWFRVSVPERTLYNWQTAAAKLVAQDIQERYLADER